jgi:hypothetical protein
VQNRTMTVFRLLALLALMAGIAEPKLKKVGLRWANFLVMRRTFVSLNKARGADAKTVADQAGHDVGVSLRDYAQTPIEVKRALVNKFEKLVLKPK